MMTVIGTEIFHEKISAECRFRRVRISKREFPKISESGVDINLDDNCQKQERF